MNSVATSQALDAAVHRAPKASLPYLQAGALSLALLVATVLVYLPVIHHPFANIDDNGYVSENLHVQSGVTLETLSWAMVTFDDNNWHPLTWISHAIDCQMFGIDPAGHHAMNLAFHAVDAVLLLWVLLLATRSLGPSFMVAALFALHPINVESVAWMAERKTLLSMLFFLLTLGAYTWYARRPGVGRYMVVAVLFLLGLMAKPQIITLPFVLLLWDYWPLERVALRHSPFAFRRNGPSGFSGEERKANGEKRALDWRWLVVEKIPLFVICGASALLTMLAQRIGRPKYWPYSLPLRIGNAMVAYVRYIGKAFWPSHLAIMYLHPGHSLRLWQVALSALVLLAITALVLVARRYRYLPVGWFWFLGTLVPMIGIVQVGRQALADRYAYQSFLGLFIMVCWGVSDWAKRKHWPKALLAGVSLVVLAVLTTLTYRQVGYWKDNMTLWTHTAQVTSNNWMAEDMIAGILLNTRHGDEAVAHYRIAAAISPNDSPANLAIALWEQQHGNPLEAVRRYKKALPDMTDPMEQSKVYQNMAVAYRDLGMVPEWTECLRKANKLRSR